MHALCRAQATPFARVVRENRLGVRLWDMHPELGHVEPAELLPDEPRRSVIARHTVGMSVVSVV